MAPRCYERHGIRVAEFTKTGYEVRNDRDAIEIISEASACRAEMIVIPVERLGEDFFRLKTRVAGEILQKFVTYRKRVVIWGDITAPLRESSSFRDFVYECNAGREIWFVTDLGELDHRLQAASGES